MHKVILHQNIQSKKLPEINSEFNKDITMQGAFGMSLPECVCAQKYTHTRHTHTDILHIQTYIYRYIIHINIVFDKFGKYK